MRERDGIIEITIFYLKNAFQFDEIKAPSKT